MISDTEVKSILINQLKFKAEKLEKLEHYVKNVLLFNKKRNIISKNTEKDIWHRHILDSAQIIRFIEEKKCENIADLGSGAGFPGIVLAIYYSDFNFHVKLYEKSPLKSEFLRNISNKLNLKCNVLCKDVFKEKISSNYIVSRAFKKLPYILKISRENCNKNHKIILLKGRNAQDEIKKASQYKNFRYRLENSITNAESKILIVDSE